MIFDFDGTISDSYPIFARIVRQVAKDFDVEVKMSDEELLEKLMVNVKHCMDHMNFQCELSERGQAFWSYQRQYYKEFQAFPEIKPILEKSISLGKKNYIYTHSGDIVLDMLKNMGLDGCFSGIVTADHGFPQKPAPDALNALIARHQLDRAECVMIGDRELDVMAGVNAGIASIAMDPDGLCPKGLPAPYVSTYAELRKLIL